MKEKIEKALNDIGIGVREVRGSIALGEVEEFEIYGFVEDPVKFLYGKEGEQVKFKYNVGDRVRILDWKYIEKYTGGFTSNMRKFVGAIAEITETTVSKGKPAYYLDVDVEYIWDERGLVPVNTERKNRYTPASILRSGNRTIVFWRDGTKTIVKRADDESDSDYAAYTAALAIKVFGSNSAVKRIVKRTEVQKPKKMKKQKEDTEEEAKEQMEDEDTMEQIVDICPNCGNIFAGEDGGEFCGVCGHRLD